MRIEGKEEKPQRQEAVVIFAATLRYFSVTSDRYTSVSEKINYLYVYVISRTINKSEVTWGFLLVSTLSDGSGPLYQMLRETQKRRNIVFL